MTRLLAILLALIAIATTAATKRGQLPQESWQVTVTDSAVRSATPIPNGPLGIWEASADGARIAIIDGAPQGMQRTLGDSYLMVVLASPRPSLVAGTVMGWCTPLAKRGYFDAYIFTRAHGPRLSRPRRFTLHMADDATLTMQPANDGLQFLPWRLIPYLFRSSIRQRRERATDLDGFRRLWPLTTAPPPRPAIL